MERRLLRSDPNLVGTAPLTALTLKELGGQLITLDGVPLRFQGAHKKAPVLHGGEGYVVPVIRDQATARLVLKLYKAPCEQRRRRTLFLSLLDLGLVHPVFCAAPQRPINDNLRLPAMGETPEYTVRAEGYLCSWIEGKSLHELAGSGWTASPEVRIFLAFQLCSAIRILECAGIVHGDLSSKNLFVIEPEGPWPEIRLIDFDGFYFPNMPVLPATDGGRTLGSDGYRARKYSEAGDDCYVTTDRVAMAALVSEILCLSKDDVEQRDTLLDQGEIDSGRALSALPRVQQACPAAAALVERAFSAATPLDAPGPDEWCAAFQTLFSPPELPLAIRVEAPGLRGEWKLRSASAPLGKIAPILAGLSYRRRGEVVELHGQIKVPMFHRSASGIQKLPPQISIVVSAGDYLRAGDLHIFVKRAERA